MNKKLRMYARYVGFAILVISTYMSFDGFDGSVNGTNAKYTAIGVIIGIVLALAVAVIQFIFSSNYSELNSTLIVMGLLSYVYSIYTNKLGAQNILGMEETMAWITAAFLDIIAEPMIAWGMGESRTGDLVGNIVRALSGESEKKSHRTVAVKQSKFNRPSQGSRPVANVHKPSFGKQITPEILDKIQRGMTPPWHGEK